MEFKLFYREALPGLVAFLVWVGVPVVDAADVAQNTMIKAFVHWPTIDHPHAWIRRVASRNWAKILASPTETAVGDIPERAPLLQISDVSAWETRHDVLRALKDLPPRQRQVLAWTLDGFTPSEIAAELGMTAEAVRSSLRRARRALSLHLADGGNGQ